MAFNVIAETEYKKEVDGILFEGKLPNSALEQFDIYQAMLSYWQSKTPETWAILRNYIVSNTNITETKTKIKLSVNDLNFKQVKIMIDTYIAMATDFFASPTQAE